MFVFGLIICFLNRILPKINPYSAVLVMIVVQQMNSVLIVYT